MAAAEPFEFDLSQIQALPPERQRQELAKIALLKQRLEANPLWTYVPHEGDGGKTSWGQLGFHRITSHMGAFVAGNRAGKTHCGAADLLIQTLGEEWLPPWLRPFKRWDVPGGFQGRVVGVDLPNWLEKVMLPKLRKLIPAGALYKGEFGKAYSDRHHKLQFADGSWWDFLTHDMDIDAYAGAGLHMIWFDEEPPGEKGRQQFEESEARTTDYDGEIRLTLTPLLGLSWVFHELTDQFGNPRDDDEVVVVRGEMDHNPHTSTTAKERLLKRWQTDPLMAEARRKGQWVHFAGMIYDEYRDAPPVVIPDRPIPRKDEEAKPSVPIYCGIDAGIHEDHKAALVFAWVDEEDVMEVFYAQKFADLIVEQVAEIYHSTLQRLNFRPRWNVIDPSARNRNPQTGRSLQWAFEQQGIYTQLGQNSRMAGFNEVKTRLRTDRLRLHAEACAPLRDEFVKYRWKTARGRREDSAPAEPIKINDDLLDALRYLAMSMPLKAPSEKREPPEPMVKRLAREDIERHTIRRRPRQVGTVRR